LLQVHELREHQRLFISSAGVPPANAERGLVWSGHSCPLPLTLILLMDWKPSHPSSIGAVELLGKGMASALPNKGEIFDGF
jgi:hypothetical protein